jgi:putative membrane protein
MASPAYKTNSNWLLLIQAVRMARTAWIVILPLVISAMATDGGLRVTILLFLAYYVYTRLYNIVYERLCCAYICSDQGITIRRGMFGKTTSSIPWSEIRSITSNASVLHQLFHCSQLKINVLAKGGDDLVLAAISEDESHRILELFRGRSAAGAPPPPVGSAPSVQGDHEILTENLRVRDYAMIGFAYGRIFLIVPFILTLLDKVGSVMGIKVTPFEVMTYVSELPLMHLIYFGAATLGLGILYGSVRSWLQFRSFSVRHDGINLYFRGGLLDREERTVPLSYIRLIVIRENLIMRASGMAQFRCIAGGSDGSMSRSMLLPLVSLTQGYKILSRILPEAVFEVHATTRAPRAYSRVLLAGWTVAFSGTIWALLSLWEDLWAIAVILAVFAIFVLNSLASSVRHPEGIREDYYVVSVGHIWRSTWVFLPAALESMTVTSGPVRQLYGVSSATARYRDRRVRRITIKALPTVAIQRILMGITQPRTPSYLGQFGRRSP